MSIIIAGNINIEPLLKAQKFLLLAIKEARSDLEKAGAIQGFEICYELSWKSLKRVLSYRGIEVASPREVYRLSAREKLIDDPETWFDIMVKRNLTVHIYDAKVANEIFSFLPYFSHELNQLIETLKSLK